VNVDWGHVGAVAAAAATATIAPDPAVPMRDRFADVDELTAQLGMSDRTAELLNVWYIPGKSLQAVYRLTPGGGVLRVRFLPPDAPPPALAPPGTVMLDDWSAVGWWFPTDPALPELAILGEPGALDARVGPVVASRLLSYLPGERCALRVRTAEDGGRELVVKVERPAETRAAAAAVERLWRAPERAFAMPEPVGVDAAAGLRWERFVPGARLDADLSPGALRKLLPVVARDLGALHRVDDPALEPLGPAQVLDRIERKVLPRIDAALPGLSDRARELVAALEATAPAADADAHAALHGDLHTANVLVGADGAVTFLDLDRLARGHAAFDLALLGGRFLLVALSRGADVAPVAAAVAELPHAYRAATGVEVTDGEFAWYMAAHLLGRQLRTCIRHWVPGVGLLAPTLLEWAATTVAGGRFRARVVG
jgi:aminoglycoside phosphotransferase (APT) family kinase protein